MVSFYPGLYPCKRNQPFRVKNADYEQALVPADDMVCLGFFNGK